MAGGIYKDWLPSLILLLLEPKKRADIKSALFLYSKYYDEVLVAVVEVFELSGTAGTALLSVVVILVSVVEVPESAGLQATAANAVTNTKAATCTNLVIMNSLFLSQSV